MFSGIRAFTVATATLALASAALAHNVWLEPEADGSYLLQFGGHAGQLEALDPAKLQSVTAWDRRGRSVPAAVQMVRGGLKVQPGAGAALLAVALDNGFFSGKAGDTALRQVPMDQNPGATRGVWARKYHKTVIVWGAMTQKELGQKFELIPQQGQVPHAGQSLPLLVHLDGKRLAGVRISQGENGPPITSDAQGLARVPLMAGTNTIQAIYRQPVQNDPRTTEYSYEYLLRLAVH